MQSSGTVHSLERKDAALLAILAIDGPLPRAKAARLLWPDASDEQARTSLRQRLFRLRRIAKHALVLAGATLRLADDVSVDVAELSRELAGDPAAARGDLLGTHVYSDSDALAEWARVARKRLHDNRLNVLAQVASELEAKGQIAAALQYAQRIVDEDPLLEHAHRRLMRLHYLRGDRAAALSAYERCREVLASELDTRPGAESVQLAALVSASGALPEPAPARRPVAALRPPKLVGRHSHWREIERACNNGGAALVEGEPGIGKTRLLTDFAAAAGDVPVIGARPGDAQLPYALLARTIRGLSTRFRPPVEGWVLTELARIVPEFGRAPTEKLDRLRLQQAVVQALREWRAEGLALVVVDDLQFADVATLELLPSLVTAIRDPGVAWLLGVRTNEMPAELRAWIDMQDTDSLSRVLLGPLDKPAVEALLRSMEIAGLDAGAWAESLSRHTGGNPLFILETLLAMSDAGAGELMRGPVALPAPQPVGALIERRLAQLSAPALRIARLAAIAGPDFDVELAVAVLGQQALDIADTWCELEAAHVLRDQTFAHDLIYEATLRSVPSAIARILHGDVAGVLEARRAPAARVAAHWSEAGAWSRAGAAFVEAARSACAASRRVEESELWDRAVESYKRDDDPANAFQARCDSIPSMLATRPLSDVLAATAQLASDARSPAEQLEALSARGTALLVASRSADALQVATQARELARELEMPWREFDAARTLSLALAQLQRAGEGVRVLKSFATMVEANGNTVQRYGYWSDFAYVVQLAGKRRVAADAHSRAITLAENLGDVNEAVTCMSNLAGLLGQLGRPCEALVRAEEAHRLRARLGESEGPAAGAVAMNLATFDAALGRYDRALQLFEDAYRKFGQGADSPWPSVCETHMANTLLQLGQFARARQALRPVPDKGPSATRARRLVIEARIDRALGAPAFPRLRQALALLDFEGDPLTRMLAQLDVARDLDPAEAVTLCLHVSEVADSMEHAGVSVKAGLLEIDAHLRAGDMDSAIASTRAMQATIERCRPADLYWPEAWWILSRSFDAAGDVQATNEALRVAAQWIEHTALPHVPPFFKDSFLHRNPVNRAVLAAARRRLGT